MFRNRTFILFFSLFLAIFSTSAYAAEETLGDYFYGISTKFGRGLWNVVSSPADLPCTFVSEGRENPGTGYVTGFGLGVAYMLRRILVGVTEVGTFMIPMERTIPAACHESV